MVPDVNHLMIGSARLCLPESVDRWISFATFCIDKPSKTDRKMFVSDYKINFIDHNISSDNKCNQSNQMNH